MSAPSSSSSAGKPDRLFVGNLAPTVDEYTLVQVFSKHGKITKLDLMFHKSGPLKGKPRGYAFVEYASKDDALKALVKLHDRLLRGRKLVVTYANAAPVDEGMMLPKARRVGDAGKPTTLSLLKAQRRPQSAAAQIAAMEAKLASMQKRSNRTPTPEREAAEALEAEIQRELEGGGQGHANEVADEPKPESADGAVSGPTSPVGGTDTPEPEAELGNTVPHTLPADLPVRTAVPVPTKVAKPRNERSAAREEAFQRGLAGLPKKPTFSSF